jgi:23S rRNA-/tRNA-specific pseudouridylate synthase
MILIKKHKVDKELNIRLYDYCINIFSDIIPSKKGIKIAIIRNEILLNGKKSETGRYIKKGDLIELYQTEKGIPKTYKLKLKVLFEDDDLAVILKPAGISVSGNKFKTIKNALPYNLKKSEKHDALKFPHPTHRLDNQTSGLLLIAKTKKAVIDLGNQFENKIIKKKYYAIVIGSIDDKGKYDCNIENKPALTYFKKISEVKSIKNKYLSLIELQPVTGRTHQLRIHLSKAGFPILGDKLYGKDDLILKRKGLFLFSFEISFLHPVSKNEITIKTDIPEKFIKLIKREQKMFDNKYNS